jgi:O-antigen/teichoic acid export membrane protein
VPAAQKAEERESAAASGGSHHILATAKGGGFLAAGSLFELAIRFLIGLLLARSLGATDYGLYVLAIGVVSLFAGISLLGADDAMVRYVAILSGRGDHRGVAGTLQVGLGIAVLGGVVMGVVLFLCAEPIASGLFSEPELARVLRLLAVVVPFLTVSNALLGIARGFKRMDYAALSQNGVQSLVRLLLVAVLALPGWLSLYPAAIAFGLSDVAASLALIHLLNRTFSLRSAARRGMRRDLREIFSFALPLWLAGLLRQFRNNIQSLLLGVMGSVANVGVFAVASRMNDVAAVGSKSVYIASRPLFAQLHDRRDRGALHSLYVATTRWTFALNVPFLLVMVLYADALLMLFGHQFRTGTTALVILACAQMIAAGTGTCQGMLDMTGHTRVKLANTIAWTILLTGGGAYAIPRWGVVGAAAASLLAIGVVNIASVVEVWFLERLLPYDLSFLKPTAAGIGAFVAGLLLRASMPVHGPMGAVVQGTIVGAVYVLLYLALGLEPQDRFIVERTLSRVRTLLTRRRSVASADVGGSA